MEQIAHSQKVHAVGVVHRTRAAYREPTLEIICDGNARQRANGMQGIVMNSRNACQGFSVHVNAYWFMGGLNPSDDHHLFYLLFGRRFSLSGGWIFVEIFICDGTGKE